MKIVWVFLLLAILLAVVQGKGGKGGGGKGGGGKGWGWGGSKGVRTSSGGFKKTIKKAAIVGAVAYGGYQVGLT